MPKMKTNRAAAKRFKISGTGRVRNGHRGVGHAPEIDGPEQNHQQERRHEGELDDRTARL